MNSYDYEDRDSEEAFMEGYEDDMEVDECQECGSALREETFTKTIDAQDLQFCNIDCARDFKNSL